MQTVLITGCSSGFGLETARLFLERGWQVVATMRTPRTDVLPHSERLRVLPMDVTDAESVRQAVAAIGHIDVLVNNAGMGAGSPVELTSMDTARALLETNTLGTLTTMQAVLPQFRERRAGVIINVSSSVTLKPLPIIGLYRASKMAMNAMSESLAVELAPLGVRVHVVLPGRAPSTQFGANARAHMQGFDHPDYAPTIQSFLQSVMQDTGPVTYAADVAEAVWKAATDADSPLRMAAGADAEQWLAEAVV